MTELEKARVNMIKQQLLPGEVTDEKVLAAMSVVPREQFLAPPLKDWLTLNCHCL